jgi:hypothetical protein
LLASGVGEFGSVQQFLTKLLKADHALDDHQNCRDNHQRNTEQSRA